MSHTRYEIKNGDTHRDMGLWAFPSPRKGRPGDILGPFSTFGEARRAVFVAVMAEIMDEEAGDFSVAEKIKNRVINEFSTTGANPERLADSAAALIDEEDCVDIIGFDPFHIEED